MLKIKCKAPVVHMFNPLNYITTVSSTSFSLVLYPHLRVFVFSPCLAGKFFSSRLGTACYPFSLVTNVTSKKHFPDLPSKRTPSLFLHCSFRQRTVWCIAFHKYLNELWILNNYIQNLENLQRLLKIFKFWFRPLR